MITVVHYKRPCNSKFDAKQLDNKLLFCLKKIEQRGQSCIDIMSALWDLILDYYKGVKFIRLSLYVWIFPKSKLSHPGFSIEAIHHRSSSGCESSSHRLLGHVGQMILENYNITVKIAASIVTPANYHRGIHLLQILMKALSHYGLKVRHDIQPEGLASDIILFSDKKLCYQ